jgi:hypothetical protein
MVSGMESGDEWGIQCEVPITEYDEASNKRYNIKDMIIA